MKAAVYYNNNDIRIEDMPKPKIGAGDILVKVCASGICGSDVLEWYRIKKAPIVLGHEISGIIEEIGKGVNDFEVGDRVAVSHHVPCMECRYCKAGNHTVCTTLQSTNFYPGGFCEYIRAPKINVDIGTFKIPDKMSFEQATFIEPLGCVVRGQRNAGLKSRQTVLVMGSGISGLLHILLAKANGAERILATDISDYKLDMAKKCGADFVFNAKEDIVSKIFKNNEDKGVDCVIVCTGAFSAFKQSLSLVDRAGSILCFATSEPGLDLSIPINEFWRKSIKLLSSYAAAPCDLEEALELIGSNKITVEQLITHKLPLDDAKKGFKLMADSKESLKVILEP